MNLKKIIVLTVGIACATPASSSAMIRDHYRAYQAVGVAALIGTLVAYNYSVINGVEQRMQPAGVLEATNFIHNWKLDVWPTARAIKENAQLVAHEMRAAAVSGEMRSTVHPDEYIGKSVLYAINTEIAQLELYKEYISGYAHFGFGTRGVTRNFNRACAAYVESHPGVPFQANYPADWTYEQEAYIDALMMQYAQENDPYWIFPNYRYAVRTYWTVCKHIFRLRAMAAALMADGPQEVIVYNK